MIGGGRRPAIQSMTNTNTADVKATVEQILRLEEAGCEIVRSAVPDMEAADAIGEIKKRIHIPLVADIHFDYRLALKAMENGVDKIRINPGNIGDRENIKKVVDMAKEREVPIRIGVNGGSLERDILQKYAHPTAEALCESAMRHVDILHEFDYDNIVVSMKGSDLKVMTGAYRLFDRMSDIPLHIGVTEAGTAKGGLIKSAIGIGSLLLDGIGDTVRVSLTADPVDEIYAAIEIYKALGLMRAPQLISCPTCGRTRIDLIPIAQEVERQLQTIDADIKVAVMGCAVNGPGEAREADIGIAGGVGEGLLFKKGQILRKVPQEKLVEELMKEVKILAAEKKEAK